MILRKALISDIKSISELIEKEAKKGLMLFRDSWELSRFLRDFAVAIDEKGNLLGCSALTIYLDGKGEIRSLVVKEEARGKGIGKALVDFCLKEAKDLGIKRVFVLTYLPEFFKKFGFTLGRKESIPQKVYEDCLHCPRFYTCDKTFLFKDIF